MLGNSRACPSHRILQKLQNAFQPLTQRANTCIMFCDTDSLKVTRVVTLLHSVYSDMCSKHHGIKIFEILSWINGGTLQSLFLRGQAQRTSRGQAEHLFFSNYTAVSWFEGFQLRRQTLAANDTCDSYTNSKLWRYTLRHRQSWRLLGCTRTLATRFWYGSWQ